MTSRPALITIGDSRDEVYEQIEDFAKKSHLEAVRYLREKYGFDLIYQDQIVRNKQMMLSQIEEVQKQGAEAVIFFFPIWGPAHLVVIGSRKLNCPVLLLTNKKPHTAGLVGLTLAGAALDEVGIKHKRVWGELNENETVKEVTSFIKASSVVYKMRGQTYGVFGGRTLGMYSATADLAQCQRIFGVDIEHIDQLEIVREAEKFSAEIVNRYINWFKNHCGYVETDGKVVNEAKFQRQIRSYLAVKKITWEMKLDFIGVKCMPELGDKYVNQCLSCALMNDPYDAEGPKEPTVYACEADHNGALTMQILKLLSEGKSTVLMNVRHIIQPENIYVFCNCGAMATWFAGHSDDPSVNLKNVHLRPQIQGKAGGFSTQFISKAGEATLARLCRKKGEYWMAIFKGNFIEQPREKLKETSFPWPHAFVKMQVEPKYFIETFGSNHIHAVMGDYIQELKELCELLEIRSKIYC